MSSVEVAPQGSEDWITVNSTGGEHTDLWGVSRVSPTVAVNFLLWNEDLDFYDANKADFLELAKQYDLTMRNNCKYRTKPFREALRAYVCGCLAGPISGDILDGRKLGDLDLEPGDGIHAPMDDITKALGYCQLLPFRKEFYHLADETEKALREPIIWKHVLDIARQLQERCTLEMEDLDRLLPEHRWGWPPSPFSRKIVTSKQG